jgi:glycosyltransferase involved in cell wall biosynthesis
MVHYNEHPSGRKWDKLCNFLATDIIAISKNIRKILIERDGASPQKIHLLYHGFEFAYFDIDSPDRISELRRKYDIPTTAKPVIGIIARYMEWKGIQYAIPAFQDVLKTYPEAHLVLANAHGEYAVHIRKLLKAIPRSAYTEISYEEDLAALYRLFDVYVHVPVDSTCEAFGQTYVEALAVGIPAVFTLSGIAPEFIRDRYNALVVDYRNVDAIAQAISEILRDVQLRERLIATGRDSIGEFAAENMQRNLENIYG